jgi:hypothetical protein
MRYLSSLIFSSLLNLVCVGVLGGSLLGLPEASAKAAPLVGKDAARKYMRPNRESAGTGESSASLSSSGGHHSSGDHILMLQAGGYVNSDVWKWNGDERLQKVGRNTYGLTYKTGDWSSGIDANLRVDFSEFQIGEERPFKMSLMPLLTFPDADSHFPLYFGVGAGVGIFFKQIENASNLSFDYQLVAGVRLMDLFESAGIVFEGGLKNHLHVLSLGQYNSVFLDAGLIFAF